MRPSLQVEVGLTSSPSLISRNATSSMPLPSFAAPPLGNTTTAFGSQEWFRNASKGETTVPIGSKDDEAKVNEFEPY